MPLAEQVVAGLGGADADRLRSQAVRAVAESALAVLAAHRGTPASAPTVDVPSRAAWLAVRAHADAGHDDPGGPPGDLWLRRRGVRARGRGGLGLDRLDPCRRGRPSGWSCSCVSCAASVSTIGRPAGTLRARRAHPRPPWPRPSSPA